jgi:hypothetical protein
LAARANCVQGRVSIHDFTQGIKPAGSVMPAFTDCSALGEPGIAFWEKLVSFKTNAWPFRN